MTDAPAATQRTLAAEATLEGVGLHTGSRTRVVLKPAPEGYGRRCIRSDIAGSPELTVHDLDVTCAPGRTSLAKDGASVETIEHVMAALAGMSIDNALIEVEGPEPPAGDGSARVFAEMIERAGITHQAAPREAYVIEEPVVIEQDGARVVALPMAPARDEGALACFGYSLYYRESEVARGWYELELTEQRFLEELSKARTFCMARDVERLKTIGLGRGATYENTLVIEGRSVVGNELRYPDEPVRHKLLDLVGDLGLVGAPVVGRMIGFRSGHRQNWKLVKHILKNVRRQRLDALFPPPVMRMKDIEQILPHRYPFLLVDSVIDLEPDKRIVAVKNVSGNEEFFAGHFPGNAVMPGVLQTEALAQAAGLLLSQYVRVGEKMAALVGLDRVKMRRPVVPGDRLLLDITVKKVRHSLCVCEGVATVSGEVATEATFLFGLIRGEPAGAS